LTTILFSLVIGLAMVVGAYIAMSMVLLDFDVGFKTFSEKIGKVVAVWSKNYSGMKGTLSGVKDMFSVKGLTGLAAGKLAESPLGTAVQSRTQGLTDAAAAIQSQASGIQSQASALKGLAVPPGLSSALKQAT
jgi:hypothetical protein